MRIMGDAIHVNVPQLALASDRGDVEMVAGYVTGTPDILWTAADWVAFTGRSQVTIDQGYQSPLITTATVRDVETGAWSIVQAVLRNSWTAARRTIYVSLANLPALEQAGWKGDVWLADWTGTPPAQPVMPAGMTCVAVQYTNQGGGGAYDLSVVFDPTWPDGGNQMALLVKGSGPGVYLLDGGKMAPVNDQQSLTAIQGAGVQLVTVTDATLNAWLAAFPPGNPTVTVGNITFPSYTVTPNPAV